MTNSENSGNLRAERTAAPSGGNSTTKTGDADVPAARRGTSSVAPTESGSVAAGQRWLARLAFVAIAAAFLVFIPAEGPAGLRLVLLGMVGSALFLAGGFFFLAKRGAQRWLGLAVAVLAVAGVVIGFLRADAIVWALASVILLLIGGAAARHALRHTPQPWMPATAATPPAHAFIVMNPRSGGGKVVKFGLQQKAEELGAEVALLDGPGYVDVGALVRAAADRGADVLGVAGGDGTQALVAGIAAERDIPLLVISAGTRNHFALDLGLDREDPASCLQALTDGEEVRVDLGMIGDRPFVNNASFGAYAEIVQSPEYRDNKNRTMLDMLPDLLGGRHGTDLTARVGERSFDDLQAVLVSNNPYGAGRMSDLARRARLDDGTLGVLAVKMNSVGQAVSLLRRARYRGVDKVVADGDVVIDASSPTLPVGIDGEAVIVPTPVHCSVRPRALRVLLPRNRPGVPPPRPRIDWTRLWHIAVGRGTKKE